MNVNPRLCLLMAALVFCFKAGAQSVPDGLRCLDNEQYAKAGEIFRSLAQAQPTAAHFYYLGHFYMTLDRVDSAQGLYADSAKIMFEKGIQADPKFNLNYVGLGTWEIYRERPGQGKILIDKAVTASKGKDAELLYRAADAWVIYPASSDALESNRLLDMAIKINKSNPDYYNLKGDAFMLKNDGSQAANNYDQAKRIAPNAAKAYINYGNILIRAKSYQKALESYLEGMAKDPEYTRGYRQLGELYYKAGKFDKAVESYSKYVSLSDQRPQSQYRFGAFLFLARDYDKAIQVLNALPESYKNVYRNRLLAYCMAEKQQHADGLNRMELFRSQMDSTKLMPNDDYYYGRLLIESGKDSSRGLLILKRAAEKDTSKFAVISDYGKKFFAARKYPLAIEAYQMVLDGGSKNNQDYFNLANAYYFGKDFVKADTMVSRLLRMQPQAMNANLLKARCINQQKLDPDQKKGLAKPFYEKFTLLVTPENADKYKKQLLECYLYLGGFYATIGDVPQAHAAWKKVLELDPENKKAKDGLLINK
jgi:tetratricopeptide (TPR) repeat protein